MGTRLALGCFLKGSVMIRFVSSTEPSKAPAELASRWSGPDHPARRGEIVDLAAMVRGNPTYLWAAELVLRKHGRPLRAREIVNYAQEQGLFSDEMHSRTPQKS